MKVKNYTRGIWQYDIFLLFYNFCMQKDMLYYSDIYFVLLSNLAKAEELYLRK